MINSASQNESHLKSKFQRTRKNQAAQVAHFDLKAKLKKTSHGGFRETTKDNLFKKLKEKPEDFFAFLPLSQGFTEE